MTRRILATFTLAAVLAWAIRAVRCGAQEDEDGSDIHDAGNSDASFIIAVLLGLVVAGAVIDNGVPVALDYLQIGWDWAWGGVVAGAEWATTQMGF